MLLLLLLTYVVVDVVEGLQILTLSVVKESVLLLLLLLLPILW